MIVPINDNDYSKKALYTLICDACGRVGRSQGTFAECKQACIDKGWKYKSIRTKSEAERYLWSHVCKVCNFRNSEV